MVVIVTCKNNDLLKMKALESEQHFSHYKSMGILRRPRTANSAVLARIGPNCELIRDFMVVLLTCKNEEDPIKNEEARVLTRFSP